MFFLFLCIFVSFFILIILFLSFLLKKKMSFLCEISSFETGFAPVSSSLTFSVNFFILLILFVLFDMEIVLLLGILFVMPSILFSFWIILSFIGGSLFVEWCFSKLLWLS